MIYEPVPISRTDVFFALCYWAWEPTTYVNPIDLTWITRYDEKELTVPGGFPCDGSTCSPNLGLSWLFHDCSFEYGVFDDGSPMLWRQANRIMQDIQEAERVPRKLRKMYRAGIRSTKSLEAWRFHRKQDELRDKI